MTRDTVFYTETMAKVHAGQGNLEKAAEIYRYLLERDPDRQDIKDALSEIEKPRLEKGTKKAADLAPLLGKWIDLVIHYNQLQKLKKLQSYISSEDQGERGGIGDKC